MRRSRRGQQGEDEYAIINFISYSWGIEELKDEKRRKLVVKSFLKSKKTRNQEIKINNFVREDYTEEELRLGKLFHEGSF